MADLSVLADDVDLNSTNILIEDRLLLLFFNWLLSLFLVLVGLLVLLTLILLLVLFGTLRLGLFRLWLCNLLLLGLFLLLLLIRLVVRIFVAVPISIFSKLLLPWGPLLFLNYLDFFTLLLANGL